MSPFRRLGMSLIVRCWLGKYRWYRRWYGGRWEYWWIDVCCSALWLDCAPGKGWPRYRQPCGFGTPKIEDYPRYE